MRWVEIIEAFAARGVTHVVECGPGRVLTGLNKRIVRELEVASRSRMGPTSTPPKRRSRAERGDMRQES